MAKAGRAVATAKIKARPVIPPAMLPMEAITEVQGSDGVYLQRNDAWFTGVKHSQGEFSAFFMALRDEGRVIGHRCPQCQHVIIPPFMRRCPSCNFVEMKKEYVNDTGIMCATPVITVFAPSRFKGQEPFGTGRVFLEAADGKLTDTAMLVRVRTTRGTIRPGIYKKGTPIKLVFCDSRQGEILDVFAVPRSELTPKQLAKSPLFEGEIEWGRLSDMGFRKPTSQRQKTLEKVRTQFQKLAALIPRSARATANLANWRRAVAVRTGGGSLGLVLHEGKMQVLKVTPKNPDLVVAVEDPAILLAWVRDCTEPTGDAAKSPPLTDLVIEGTLVLNKPELETITRLDRVPRSLRRDSVVKVRSAGAH